jgi:hypothetical protein
MKPLLIILLSLFAPCITVAADNEAILTQLDKSLAKKAQYERIKVARIDRLRSALAARHAHPAESYRLSKQLFDEYKSYKYDSAYHYATQALQVASRLHNADHMVSARCDLVFCMLSAGLYKEALDEAQTIDITQASAESRKLYYNTLTRLYYDLSDYNRAAPYQKRYLAMGSAYTDSLLRYVGQSAPDSLYAVGMRQMKESQFEASQASFKALLQLPEVDLHTRAIVTSSLGWICIILKDQARAIDYLAQAAICDNETVTKETTALCSLGGLLYKRGDIQRATDYVRLSMADANFYDARQRIIQSGQILPIIEQDRFNIMKSQRNAFIGVAVVSALLVVALLGFTIIIRGQMRRLQKARRAIERTNHALQTTIEQLSEANEIKDEYIGRSFFANSEYVAKIEHLFRTIDRKITARQYDDLRSSLRESTLKSERENMYASFDETFLKLFPHFVEGYNELFAEADRKIPADKSLTTEMRIFALIRLGVTDAERIASFLNYSVNTINTYKTRVKNRSTVANDLFEQRIMEL